MNVLAPDENAAPAPRREIGLFGALSLVVSSMVGTGVFTTGGLLAGQLGPLATLVAWAVGGLVALSGALVYGEAVAALPRSGGEYHLLGRIYHPAVGFVAGTISLVVGFAAPMAASAIAFGHYLTALIPQASPTRAAAGLIAALALLHAVHGTLSYRVQGLITLAELGLMLLLIACAALRGTPHQLVMDEASLAEGVTSPAFAVGLIFVAFAYSGWNGAVYVASEVRRPERTLPLALVVGTLIVMGIYLGINAAFLSAVPASDLVGVVEVGHVAEVRLLGQRAGAVFSAPYWLRLAPRSAPC